jgi:hypothetical protein
MKIATSSPKGFKIGAELIKQYQGTKFSHILIIKDNLVYQASHGYVNCWYIDNFLAANDIVHVYEVEDSIVDFDFVQKQLGKRYSYLQILEISFKYLTGIKILVNNGNQQFICSEFVGKALRLPWVTDLTTPLEVATYLDSVSPRVGVSQDSSKLIS